MQKPQSPDYRAFYEGLKAVLDHNLTLKSDELYLVGNIDTDGSRERATGLYLRDTRHLSRFLVTINGTRPERLQVRARQRGECDRHFQQWPAHARKRRDAVAAEAFAGATGTAR